MSLVSKLAARQHAHQGHHVGDSKLCLYGCMPLGDGEGRRTGYERFASKPLMTDRGTWQAVSLSFSLVLSLSPHTYTPFIFDLSRTLDLVAG